MGWWARSAMSSMIFPANPGDIGTLHVWFTRNMLITTRSHPLTAVDKLRLDIRNGFHPATTGELIGALIDHLAESFHKVIEDMVEGLDEIEDAIWRASRPICAASWATCAVRSSACAASCCRSAGRCPVC